MTAEEAKQYLAYLKKNKIGLGTVLKLKDKKYFVSDMSNIHSSLVLRQVGSEHHPILLDERIMPYAVVTGETDGTFSNSARKKFDGFMQRLKNLSHLEVGAVYSIQREKEKSVTLILHMDSEYMYSVTIRCKKIQDGIDDFLSEPNKYKVIATLPSITTFLDEEHYVKTIDSMRLDFIFTKLSIVGHIVSVSQDWFNNEVGLIWN